MSHQMDRQAFTLIELLVVVAIIALLISILLPSLSKARETARTVACSSNMRQFGVANQMYADECDNWFVAIVDYTYDPWYNGGVWSHNQLYRSIMGFEKEGVYGPSGIVCPAGMDKEIEAGHFPHTYGMNRGGLVTQTMAVHRDSLPNPSRKAQLVDANSWNVQAGWADPALWDTYGDAPDHDGFPLHTSYRHDEAVNYQHFDGHVSLYTREEGYPPTQDEQKTLLWINEDYPDPY